MQLVVYGASGHGKVVADVARAAGWTVAGFIDDAPDKIGKPFFGAQVISWQTALDGRRDRPALALGIGDNEVRRRCFERATAAGFEVPVLVHPRAVVAESAVLRAGTVVMANAVVNPDALVEAGVILNTACVVEHDCRIGAFAHLSPGATLGGAVVIGDASHLGVGAVALPCVRVGSRVRVGAGAVLHRDVADGLTVVGVPARPLASR